jgi:hypothetical protein
VDGVDWGWEPESFVAAFAFREAAVEESEARRARGALSVARAMDAKEVMMMMMMME